MRTSDSTATRGIVWNRRKVELAIAGLVTLAALALHWINFRHAGALWRDEANLARLATFPTFHEVWSNLEHDSCPLAFPVIVRLWSAAGWGATDAGLRACGFLVGLLLIGAVWLNGWWLNRSAPLIALGLLATNATVIRWGDSLRAYGTASVFVLITLGLVWRYVRSPNRNRWLAAALAGVLSAHCLFQNAFLLLAICAAGAAVFVRRKDFRNALAALAIGVPAAVSLLMYLPVIRAGQDWSVLSQTGFIPALIWKNLSSALSAAVPGLNWLWIGLTLAVLGRCAVAFRAPPSVPDDERTSAAFFGAAALIAGLIGFFIFLRLARLPTQVWYFLPLMTFVAVCLDAALSQWPARFQAWRWLLPCVAVGSLPNAWEAAQVRQTNIDLIALALREQARPNDLILVHPWICGISFNRYYTGAAPWTTVPPLDDHRTERYDLMKIAMQLENPIQPVLDRAAATLQSGNRVWVVGEIPLNGAQPPQIRPAPNNPWGWLDDPYSRVWGAQVGRFLVTHAARGEVMAIPPPDPVSPLENLSLVWVAGPPEASAKPAPAAGAPQ